eukprot:TRINITY_DN4801_c0_g1_i1.p1 TRINITY_DN4801_c0_g1~~TRINITY_DN4801_c0_g1_i1.p1  ORF type:complete len:360 (-),score=33.39 TRINITY_DN4801_c0_g1_i1:83-1162(-)
MQEEKTTLSSKDIVLGSIGIDSGGSFTKIVYFRPKEAPDLPEYVVRDPQLPQELPGLLPDPSLNFGSGLLKFIKIPRHKSEEFIQFVKDTNLIGKFKNRLNITGGGAYRLSDIIKERLNIHINPIGEWDSAVKGLNFLMENDFHREVFTVDPDKKEPVFGALPEGKDYFPYLLVNIGSGVSILKVTGKDTFQRVSGTSLGGGTFFGLCKLLTNVDDFEKIKELSSKGDSTTVDLLVRDIYGEDTNRYDKLGLGPDIIASSFGKAAVAAESDGSANSYKSEDVIRSLMFMIANNICQIAFLNAKLHNVERIIFSGGFVAGNMTLCSRFSFGINFWSGGNMKALFLLHDGYLGALGSMLVG